MKLGRAVWYESRLERDFLLLLEFDDGVRSFEEQPITVSYESDGGHRRYTPDCRVDRQNGAVDLCEVKYAADIRSMDAEIRHHFDAANAAGAAYAAARGWNFRVVTDDEILSPRLARAHLLRLHVRAHREWSDVLQRIRSHVAREPGVTLGVVVLVAAHRHALDAALHLIAIGALRDEQLRAPDLSAQLRTGGNRP